jgi:hypothetical protein
MTLLIRLSVIAVVTASAVLIATAYLNPALVAAYF